MNNVQVLVDFWNANKHLAIPFNWLQGRTFSEAFVICIGAGPWKFGRRKMIQGQALSKLGNRDLANVPIEEAETFYPLKWQNEFLATTIYHLKSWGHHSFERYCEQIASGIRGTTLLMEMRKLTGANNSKVVSLFCRDGLRSDSFPIDRHVKRKLQELGLPDDELKMIALCKNAGIDPRLAAVMFVRIASDMDNPDWSVK